MASFRLQKIPLINALVEGNVVPWIFFLDWTINSTLCWNACISFKFLVTDLPISRVNLKWFVFREWIILLSHEVSSPRVALGWFCLPWFLEEDIMSWIDEGFLFLNLSDNFEMIFAWDSNRFKGSMKLSLLVSQTSQIHSNCLLVISYKLIVSPQQSNKDKSLFIRVVTLYYLLIYLCLFNIRDKSILFQYFAEIISFLFSSVLLFHI